MAAEAGQAGVDRTQSTPARMGLPEKVSALAVYLASAESSFSTGAEFLVDGGMTAGAT